MRAASVDAWPSKVPSIRVNAGRKFGWMRGASVDAWRIRWSQSHPVDAGRNGVRDNQVSWMRDASTDAWRIGFRLESERDWNVAVILGIGCRAHPEPPEFILNGFLIPI